MFFTGNDADSDNFEDYPGDADPVRASGVDNTKLFLERLKRDNRAWEHRERPAKSTPHGDQDYLTQEDKLYGAGHRRFRASELPYDHRVILFC